MGLSLAVGGTWTICQDISLFLAGRMRTEAGMRGMSGRTISGTPTPASALMHGETVLTIGRLLGHDHPGTTLKYTNFADAAAREAGRCRLAGRSEGMS